MMENSRCCNKHDEPIPLFPCKIFGNVPVGYYCVVCHGFIPKAIVPEVDLLNKLMEICRNGILERREV